VALAAGSDSAPVVLLDYKIHKNKLFAMLHYYVVVLTRYIMGLAHLSVGLSVCHSLRTKRHTKNKASPGLE